MIEQFIKDLLKEKQLPANLEPEVYDRMVKDLSERAIDLMNRRLIDAMTEEQAMKFDELLKTEPDAQAVQDFIAQSLPNKELVVADALREFRQLYLGTK